MEIETEKLRRMINAAAYWTLPPGIEFLLKKTLCKMTSKKKNVEKLYLSKKLIVQLKDKHLGERCFILATGPSIQEQDLTVLEGELCIAVSHFFLHKDIKRISPRYHVLAPYHPPFSFIELDKVFRSLNEAYEGDVTLALGHTAYEFSAYNFLQKNPEYLKKNYFFIDYSKSQPLGEVNYMLSPTWDIAKAPFQVRTVIYSAIQLAAYMGCKKIYLLGCDHDYLHDMQRVTNHHFYREEDGVSDAEHLSAFTTERWLEEYYFRWKQYRLMREYLKSIDCDIYNSTHGGMLDVFPRVPLCEAVEHKKIDH